ncbi:hypothetical protein Tco_0935655 [Tanacetum coccineum]
MATHSDAFIALPGCKIRQVQNDGKHGIDEKLIAVKKPKVSEIKDSYLLSRIANRKLGNVDFGWSNTAAAKADCTINGLLYDLRSWATNGSNKVSNHTTGTVVDGPNNNDLYLISERTTFTQSLLLISMQFDMMWSCMTAVCMDKISRRAFEILRKNA